MSNLRFSYIDVAKAIIDCREPGRYVKAYYNEVEDKIFCYAFEKASGLPPSYDLEYSIFLFTWVRDWEGLLNDNALTYGYEKGKDPDWDDWEESVDRTFDHMPYAEHLGDYKRSEKYLDHLVHFIAKIMEDLDLMPTWEKKYEKDMKQAQKRIASAAVKWIRNELEAQKDGSPQNRNQNQNRNNTPSTVVHGRHQGQHRPLPLRGAPDEGQRPPGGPPHNLPVCPESPPG